MLLPSLLYINWLSSVWINFWTLSAVLKLVSAHWWVGLGNRMAGRGARGVSELVLVCWWVGWILPLQAVDCSHPRADVHLLVGRSGAQRVLELLWPPGRPSGQAFTVTLTHGSLTPFKGCDFLQSDPHGSIGFGRERWLTRGTGRLELGQVHQQRPCGADALIQPWCQFVSSTSFHFLVPPFCVSLFLYNLLCVWKSLVYLKCFYWFIGLTVI